MEDTNTNIIDYSAFEPDDIELRRRKALQTNPHGLTFEQAMEAFAAYFTADGKAELQWLIDREYARDFYGDVPRIAEVGDEIYSRFEQLTEQKYLICRHSLLDYSNQDRSFRPV